MKQRLWIFAMPAIVLVQASVLALSGQPLWCKCHSLVPWSWVVLGMHNSQHLIDPYSFTHVLHGLIFFALLHVATRGRVPLHWRAVITATIEAGWELLENSHWVIDRYRAATISLDYYGDSILNSVSDVGCCLFGFWLASRLPWKASVALFVAVELVLLFWIRDNLTINILMLLHPIDAIRVWQGG